MTKIISYNVNGLRAALKKGFGVWLKAADPDIICLQEIKATPDQVDATFLVEAGYNSYWNPADKKGYSGVAIFSKIQPKNVLIGCDMPQYDCEGRVIRLDFEDFSILNVYMPSGTSGEIRQQFKYEWLEDFFQYIQKMLLEIPNLIIVGDFNICHKPIDIHNPVSNAKSSGFMPEERAWMEKILNHGFVDTFRHFNSEPHNYTWWSPRFGVRDKNLGWRIDYQIVSKLMEKRLQRALILKEARHSDHCPTYLEIN